MARDAARRYWERTGLALLLGGFLLGPLAWFLDLQVSYAIVKWTCRTDAKGVLLLIPLASLALTAGGGWMSWSCWKELRHDARPDGDGLEDPRHLLAVLGLGMNVLFGLLILASLAPRILLSPCE